MSATTRTPRAAEASELEPHLEGRRAWGMATRTVSHVVYPTSAQDVARAFALARERGWTVTPWGRGRSYGDAALNDGNLVLDMGRMDRIEAFDPDTGVVTVQPGVTIRKLWRRILQDGWWPPVVSGTMTTTLGGCAAANVHGKNNWKHGPIGEHILAFTLVTPDGAVREVTRESDPNLFHAAIGGFGALGVFTSITLQAKRVFSGRLSVEPLSCPDLDAMFRAFERYNGEGRDYVVGWMDAFARGASLGRGQIHAARYVGKGEDPEGARMLGSDDQELPLTILGFPKRWMWRLMKPWAHRSGMRLINWGRYTWASQPRNQHRHLQPHAQFNFLLDFVPDWKRVYEPGGLIQIQLFLPRDQARRVIRQALELQQTLRLESWLVVMKRHRRDPFWLSHAVDGYSFAMDFPVTARRREDLVQLGRRLERLVLEAGGRFYLAKDSLVRGEAFRRSLGPEVLGRFMALKGELDPDGLLESQQWRRVMGPAVQSVEPLPLAEGEVFHVPAQAELDDARGTAEREVGAAVEAAISDTAIELGGSEPPAPATPTGWVEAPEDPAMDPPARPGTGADAGPGPDAEAETAAAAKPEPETEAEDPQPESEPETAPESDVAGEPEAETEPEPEPRP